MTIGNSRPDGATIEKGRFKLCPTCGNFVPFADKDVYCAYCGSKFIEECAGCREPIIYPLARFCPACGARLVTQKDGDVTSEASQHD